MLRTSASGPTRCARPRRDRWDRRRACAPSATKMWNALVRQPVGGLVASPDGGVAPAPNRSPRSSPASPPLRASRRLDPAGRDLPAPRVGDEPMPPQQQHARDRDRGRPCPRPCSACAPRDARSARRRGSRRRRASRRTHSLSYSDRSPCTVHRMVRTYAGPVLSPARRRELGAFYTPVDVAERLVDIALAGLDGAPVVCDPACGDGAFLLAAAVVLAERGVSPTSIARRSAVGLRHRSGGGGRDATRDRGLVRGRPRRPPAGRGRSDHGRAVAWAIRRSGRQPAVPQSARASNGAPRPPPASARRHRRPVHRHGLALPRRGPPARALRWAGRARPAAVARRRPRRGTGTRSGRRHARGALVVR